MATIARNAATQGVYINVPKIDWPLLRELIRKFGWKAETREQLLERFINNRPSNADLSEEDIMNEVKALRYSK